MNRSLFVCTGNTCRSVMAQGLFAKLAPQYISDCAGLMAGIGNPPSEQVLIALEEIGVDMRNYQAKLFSAAKFNSMSHIFVMEPFHQVQVENAFRVNPDVNVDLLCINGEPIVDPFGKSLSIYRQCRDLILASLEERLRVKT